MKQPSLGKVALAVSVFACTTMLSVDWTEQKGASLSIERAQAQVADPSAPAPGVARRQARRAAAGTAAVGAVAAGANAAYYAGGGPYAYYGGGPYAGSSGPYGYYGGPGVWSQDYAARNGIICQPGTMVRLEDGLMHRCQ
ncbi:hypothetical protein IVB30_37185 [Bradyrhizobium sp. 200]|uniref:hypothetical protein n=1 Tax=Bradyrhizobium sp. 200 TaxID=2782665 RepID=UPI001FFE5D3A|nr:hypothetical protein [Bradyrhizobium sp. 200]UPJ48610.1 hypothetical protein IVB30_37185 [Bradyrhizobium sp. 200]